MTQRALEGPVVEGDSLELEKLRDANDRLTKERDALRLEIIELRRKLGQAGAPVDRLRQQLDPLYRALQSLYGDIEQISPAAAAIDAGGGSGGEDANKAAGVWESWKQRLGDTPAEIIGALQTHKEANTQQLAIICQRAKRTITDGIYKLTKAGLINKNGGRFSLKDLG